MPTILNTEDTKVIQDENGWKVTNLADADTFNHAAMVAQRWSLKPGARTSEIRHDEKERFLYVISGSGTAHVGGDQFRMDDEAVLWLESGDLYFLEAGSDGLELLLGFAPGN